MQTIQRLGDTLLSEVFGLPPRQDVGAIIEVGLPPKKSFVVWIRENPGLH